MSSYWPSELKKIKTPESIVGDFAESLNDAPYPIRGKVIVSGFGNLISLYAVSESQIDSFVFAVKKSGQLSWPVKLFFDDEVVSADNPQEMEEELKEYTNGDSVSWMLSLMGG